MIYVGSRYAKTLIYNKNGFLSFSVRNRFEFNRRNCYLHVFKSGDSLDLLAYKNYGDPQLWWVILEANPKYKFEMDIQVGDSIYIPTQEEMRRVYEQ